MGKHKDDPAHIQPQGPQQQPQTPPQGPQGQDNNKQGPQFQPKKDDDQ